MAPVSPPRVAELREGAERRDRVRGPAGPTCGAALQIDRAQGRIGIDRAAQQGVEIAIGFGSFVERGYKAAAELIVEAAKGEAGRQRQGKTIDLTAQQIAQRRRPDQRQIEIGPGADAIPAQRIAKAIVAMRQVSGLGNIEDAADTDGGIDRETAQCAQRAARAQLQHVVGKDDRFGEVADDIAQRRPDRRGDDALVKQRDRAEKMAVDAALRVEEAAVGAFERIAGRGRFVRAQGGSGGRGGISGGGSRGWSGRVSWRDQPAFAICDKRAMRQRRPQRCAGRRAMRAGRCHEHKRRNEREREAGAAQQEQKPHRRDQTSVTHWRSRYRGDGSARARRLRQGCVHSLIGASQAG